MTAIDIWPTHDKESISVKNERSPELESYLASRPIGYAGFRIFHLRAHGFPLSDKDEVPFVTSPLFVLAILGYIIYRRLRASISGRLSTEPVAGTTHVFTMSSGHKYRYYSFVEIASTLRQRGEDVLLLCSPDAETKRAEWHAAGLPTLTHTELHGTVPISRVLRAAIDALVVVLTVRRMVVYDTKFNDALVAYNYTLLEWVKSESVDDLFGHQPRVHTYSPMPYIQKSTSPDSIYVYQHGFQWKPETDLLMAAPWYVPLTYFVWSELWIEYFESAAHPESRIIPVGSPWYDYLSDRQSDEDGNRELDVLFVSGSHGCQTEAQHRSYESLVEELIGICERKDWRLGIKLHPVETGSWYRERGYEEHLHDFDDIDSALLGTKVAVTNASSSLIESTVLGTPMVVADVFEEGYDRIGPVENIYFADSVHEVGRLLDGLATGDVDAGDRGRSVVRLGGAVDRIVDELLRSSVDGARQT